MLKKFIAGALILACGVAALGAQSNDQLDELLAQASARLDSTAYLLLVSGGQLAENSNSAAAFDALLAEKLVPATSHPEDSVSIELLSFLVMKTQKLSGGLEWMFLPSPRAAYRELAHFDLINVTAGPQRLVAGDEVIRTLSSAVAFKRGQR